MFKAKAKSIEMLKAVISSRASSGGFVSSSGPPPSLPLQFHSIPSVAASQIVCPFLCELQTKSLRTFARFSTTLFYITQFTCFPRKIAFECCSFVKFSRAFAQCRSFVSGTPSYVLGHGFDFGSGQWKTRSLVKLVNRRVLRG